MTLSFNAQGGASSPIKLPSYLQKPELVTIPERPTTENFIVRPRNPQIGDTYYADQAKVTTANRSIERADQNKDGKIDMIHYKGPFVFQFGGKKDTLNIDLRIKDTNFDGQEDVRILPFLGD